MCGQRQRGAKKGVIRIVIKMAGVENSSGSGSSSSSNNRSSNNGWVAWWVKISRRQSRATKMDLSTTKCDDFGRGFGRLETLS